MKALRRPASNAAVPASYILATLLAALGAPGVHGAPAVAAAAANARAVSDRARAEAIEQSLPIMFEANQGQADPRVRLLARGPGYTLLLAPREAVLALEPAQGSARADFVRFEFIGAGSAVHVEGRSLLRGKTNYLLGDDPAEWHRNIPNYASAAYRSVYPGIDAVFHGSRIGKTAERLELDFELAAGADPARVALAVRGARQLRIDQSGDVLLELASGERLKLGRPHVYQDIAGTRREVTGAYVLRPGHRLAFAIGAYDRTRRLIIDPTLSYSTYFTAVETINGVAVDTAGDVYVAGSAGGGLPVFPNPGAIQTTCPGCPGGYPIAFVAKFAPAQSGAASLIYATYLGPADPYLPDAFANAIAVDASGNAYVAGGVRDASPFPTTPGVILPTAPQIDAAFVSKIDPTGTQLLLSTYLGGNGSGGGGSNGDLATGIALDSAGNVYVTGLSDSPNLATPAGAAQKTLGGAQTPFVAKLNSSFSQLLYFTYLGGGLLDVAKAIAVDSAGEAFIVGGTYSSSFPAPANAGFQSLLGGGNESGFLAKLNAAGTQLLYFTYLGGQRGTEIDALALDSSGHAYLTGKTTETSLQTTQGVPGGQSAACEFGPCPNTFVAEVNPTVPGIPSLLALTYLGGILPAGSAPTAGKAIAVDSDGDIFVAGSTGNSDLPLPGTTNLPNGSPLASSLPCVSASPRCVSGFLMELAPLASGVTYSTYLGGAASGAQDAITALALDSAGDIYLAGTTLASDGFPVTGKAFDPTGAKFGTQGFVAVITPTAVAPPSAANYSLDGQPTAGPVGFTGNVDSTITQQLVLTNGSGEFNVSGMSVSGSPAFSLTSISCAGIVESPQSFVELTLTAGESCTITIQFAPANASGGQDATLTVYDTAGSSNASAVPGGQSLALTGLGTAPFATFAPVSLNLSAPYNVPVSQTLTLTNTGTGPLTLQGLPQFTGAGLSYVPGNPVQCSSVAPGAILSWPVTLPPGGDCTFPVQFDPSAGGDVSGTLTFTDNALPGEIESNVPSTACNGSLCEQAVPIAATPIGCNAVVLNSYVSIKQSPLSYNIHTGLFSQTVTVTNPYNEIITAPFFLVIANLSGHVAGPGGVEITQPTVTNASGVTGCVAPGSPFFAVNGGFVQPGGLNCALCGGLGAEMWPGESTTFTIQFSNPSKGTIAYTPYVAGGTEGNVEPVGGGSCSPAPCVPVVVGPSPDP